MEENYYGFDYWRAGQTLAHHGIKGQKWGVRRYQNSDGSLTNAGRKRYGIRFKETWAYMRNKSREINDAFRKWLTIDSKMMPIFNNNSLTDISRHNSTINQGMAICQQQANQSAINASINAANFASSLAMTGGTTPFAFGIM